MGRLADMCGLALLLIVLLGGGLYYLSARPPGSPEPASWRCSSAIRTCPAATPSPPATAAHERGKP
jgi:hypothetical protein